MTATPGPPSAGSSDPVLLNAYAAKQCPVRVQNKFAPLVPTMKWEPTPEEQARLDAGITFEAAVFERLIALHPGIVVIDDQQAKSDAIEATLAAMDSGAPLILGGWLPDDPAGGRTGKPDILIGVDGGYLPGDVKNHHTITPATTTRIAVSSMAAPHLHGEVTGWTPTQHRYEDGLQLGRV